MLTDRFARARLLVNQNRYELAEREVTARLAEEPNDPEGYILLAICQANRGEPDRARETAQRAIELAPNDDRPHFVVSLAELKRGQATAAEHAIQRAIGLNSWNAMYHGHHAATLLAQSRWSAALAAADTGLAIDPDDEVCLNNRALALTKLGRHDEAAATLRGTLEKHPEDAFAHANRGWGLLHENRPTDARNHFRESLRLDPNSEWAKQGLLESLRAENWLYRRILQFFLWLARFSPSTQFGLLLGLYVLMRIAAQIGRTYPALSVVTTGIVIAYMLFVGLMWFGEHFMNVVLMTSPDGRLLLSRNERRISVVAVVLALVVLTLSVVMFVDEQPIVFGGWLVALVTAVHYASVMKIPMSKQRLWGIAASALVIGIVISYAVQQVSFDERLDAFLVQVRQHEDRVKDWESLHGPLHPAAQPPASQPEHQPQPNPIEPPAEADQAAERRMLLVTDQRLSRDATKLKQDREELNHRSSQVAILSIGVLLLHSYWRNRAG